MPPREEALDKSAQVIEIACEPVHAVNDYCVAVADKLQKL